MLFMTFLKLILRSFKVNFFSNNKLFYLLIFFLFVKLGIRKTEKLKILITVFSLKLSKPRILVSLLNIKFTDVTNKKVRDNF